MSEIDDIRLEVERIYRRHDCEGHVSGREACHLILQKLKSDEIGVNEIRAYVQELHGMSDVRGDKTARGVCMSILRLIDEKDLFGEMNKDRQKRKARDAAFVTQAGTNWCRTILTQMLERHGEYMPEATRECIKQAEEKLHQGNILTINCIDME